MSQWRTSSAASSLPHQQSLYLPHNGSSDALDAEDLGAAFELPPQSPVFDLEDFLVEPSSSMASSSHLPTMMVGSHSDHHLGGSSNVWATWNSPSNSHPDSSFHSNISSFSPSSMTGLSKHSPAVSAFPAQTQPRPLKYQDATIATPSSVLTAVYAPQHHSSAIYSLSQSSPYQPSAGSFSDYELALSASDLVQDSSMTVFMTGKGDNQALPSHYHEIRRTPQGDSMGGNSQYPIYSQDSMHHPLMHTARADQRRQYMPRRDSSVPPYSTEYRHAHSNTVFAASAPTPSLISTVGSFSPSTSPASLAHSSPSPSPASPYAGTPSSPSMQYSASPSLFSAAPHQFTSVSPTFTSATPITFVNHSASYANSGYAEDGQSSSAQESRMADGDDSRMRKRRRVMMTDAEDDSDERKSDDVPLRSELRPPKQAPSMWQVYFADWLQDHKTRHPQDKLNVAQAAKEAGQLYKTLNAEEKEQLKRRVLVEKDDRERRLSAWQRTLTPDDIKRENKFRAAQRKAGLSRRANIKDPNAPKKPLSAYFMFLARIRSDPVLVEEVFGGETETTRQSVLAAQRWREMSDEEKKPFLTQAEHDKIQYEALRKVYDERAGAKDRGSRSPPRKQVAGTGYIVPQQTTLSEDITAAIMSARPSTSENDGLRMVSFDPQATITARRPVNKASAIPIFSSTGTIRRRAARKSARAVNGASRSSSVDSSESDDEWVPGKSI